jgi:RNA polymerase sigma-70 factor (ECF subfamily)
MRAFRRRTKMIGAAPGDFDIEANYLRYGPMVLRRCRKLLGDEQAAYDAAQEVFLRVIARRGRLTGDYPSALLFRIATNVCLNRLREDRRRGLRHLPSFPPELVLAPAPEAAVSAGRFLDHLFEHETDETRQIAVMYFVDGMTLREIGAALELSTSGVHKRLDRLRRRIRSMGGSG